MSIEAARASRRNTPESHARRVMGRVGTNPITWLQYQVEHAVDISPETLAHIRGQFKKLRAKHGKLFSLPDDIAEREYIRIAYRLNAMRIEAAILRTPALGKGYHTASKTLGIYAAAALKRNSSKEKGDKGQGVRRRMPTAATSPDHDPDHEVESGDA